METEQDDRRRRLSLPFRPSYQGWKPPVATTTRQSLGTFRPSYQGWKRELFTISTPLKVGLLDLPIRDGNTALNTVQLKTSYLLDLPIRDGNVIITFTGITGAIF